MHVSSSGMPVGTKFRGGRAGGAGRVIAPPKISVGEQCSPHIKQTLLYIQSSKRAVDMLAVKN